MARRAAHQARRERQVMRGTNNPFVVLWVERFRLIAEEHGIAVRAGLLRAFAQEVLDKSAPVKTANARSSDPETAQEAGRKNSSDDERVFRAGSQKDYLLRQLLAQPNTAEGAATEVRKSLGVKVESVRRRTSSLLAAGYVRDSGERAYNPGSSSPATVYEVTDLGRAAIQRVDQTGKSYP